MKKWFGKYQNVLLFGLVGCIVVLMTYGFAKYEKLLSFSGNVIVEPDGKLEIESIVLIDSSNVTSSETPVFTEDKIEFNVTFEGTSNEYYATYAVELVNNSSYDYTYNEFKFTPVVNASGGGTGTLSLEVSGLNNGDIIYAGDGISFTMKLVLEPSDTEQSYETSGTTNLDTTQQEAGTILSSVATVTNDLTTDGAMAEIELRVVNTYSKDINFTVSSGNEKFTFVQQDGSDLGTLVIGANSEEVYTVYLKVVDGSVFYSDEVETLVTVVCQGIGNVNAGTIKLLVYNIAQDYDVPQIGAVSLVMDNTVGQATASFSLLDNGGSDIKSYTLILYDADSGESVSSNTLSASQTSYTFTGLDTGNYYVMVYGSNELKSGSDYINSASTDNVYCRLSETVAMQWVFSVDTSGLSNLSSDGATTVNIGETYEATLSAGTSYSLPSSITVTMGGTRLTATTDTETGQYTYNSETGELSIPNVTGDIELSGYGSYSGACLVKGTLITLANGEKKKIEEIDYTDLLLVWDYDHKRFTYEYPIWIEKEGLAREYQVTTFSDGSTLKTVGYHGIFSVDAMKFVSVDDRDDFDIGTRVIKTVETAKGYEFREVEVTNIELIHEEVNYYQVITTTYYNVISDDYMTVDGNVMLVNLYGFNSDYTWKLNRKDIISDPNNLFDYELLAPIMPYYMFVGLRAREVKFIANLGYFEMTDIPVFLEELSFINNELLLPVPVNNEGKRSWMVTTSLDKVTNKELYLVREGDEYKLPDGADSNGISGWYNTADGKTYQPGETIQVVHGMHFEAVYK